MHRVATKSIEVHTVLQKKTQFLLTWFLEFCFASRNIVFLTVLLPCNEQKKQKKGL